MKTNWPNLNKAAAAGAWCLLMAAIVHGLVTVGNPRDRKGEKVAYLSVQRGNVKFRPSESILWVDAALDQAFNDGDTIVTSDHSRAVIKVGDKQQIELGENSMVGLDMAALRAGRATDGVNLTLYKGSVVAVAKKKTEVKKDSLSSLLTKIGWDKFGINAPKAADEAPVKVKAASKEFTLASGAGLYKDPKSDKVEVSKSGLKVPVSSPPPAPLLAVVAPQAAMIDLTPPKIETPAPPKAVAKPKAPAPPPGPTPEELALIEAQKAKEAALAAAAAKAAAEKAEAERQAKLARDMGPTMELAEPVPTPDLVPLVSPNQNLTLYTGQSLRGSSCASDDVVIYVEPQKKVAEKPATWVPFLDVASAASPGKKFRVFAAGNKFGKQGVRIPAAGVCSLPRNPNAAGVALTLTPGVVFKRGGPDTAGTVGTKLFLGSLADFPAMPMTVYLSKVATGAHARSGWIGQGAVPATLAAGGYAVQLKTAQDLPAIFDLIAGSGAFVFNNGGVGAFPEKIHLASNGVILATVGAQSYKKDEIRRISNVLDANVAFVGAASDLIALPKAGVNRIGVLETALARNGQIKVMARNRIVVVRKEDFQGDPDQLKVVARNASSALKADAKVVVP